MTHEQLHVSQELLFLYKDFGCNGFPSHMIRSSCRIAPHLNHFFRSSNGTNVWFISQDIQWNLHRGVVTISASTVCTATDFAAWSAKLSPSVMPYFQNGVLQIKFIIDKSNQRKNKTRSQKIKNKNKKKYSFINRNKNKNKSKTI